MTTLRLDPQARARVQVACDVVNKEIAEQRGKVMVAFVAVALVALPLFVKYPDEWRSIGVGALILVLGVVQLARREVAKTYKGLVVNRVVKSLGSGLTYSQESSLSRDDFNSMDLFVDAPDSFTSEDEVGGKKENVSYSIHEIRATKREGKHTKVVFAGLMIRLDFNKNFRGHTIVVPDRESRALSTFARDLLDFTAHEKMAAVNLENPDFERLFSVYSTDDQEARYLLTPKLMELALEANAMQENQIRHAFVKNSLYVAIPSKENRFEAGLNDKVTPESAVGDLVEVINLTERLVDTFQLETRLWSRA